MQPAIGNDTNFLVACTSRDKKLTIGIAAVPTITNIERVCGLAICHSGVVVVATRTAGAGHTTVALALHLANAAVVVAQQIAGLVVACTPGIQLVSQQPGQPPRTSYVEMLTYVCLQSWCLAALKVAMTVDNMTHA